MKIKINFFVWLNIKILIILLDDSFDKISGRGEIKQKNENALFVII